MASYLNQIHPAKPAAALIQIGKLIFFSRGPKIPNSTDPYAKRREKSKSMLSFEKRIPFARLENTVIIIITESFLSLGMEKVQNEI
jgi:hypothetical protein